MNVPRFEKRRNLLVLRDLKSEERVSMERYADELVMMGRSLSGWDASDCVLDEAGVAPARSARDKLRRYKRRYIDYPAYAAGVNADVFHIADHAFAHLLRRLPSDRTVVTCHDLMLLTQTDWSERTRWTPAVPLLRYSVGYLKHAAKVIAVSEATKGDIVRLGLADASRVTVIPPPLAEVFSPIPSALDADVLASLKIAHGSFRILHVGTPGPYKNLQTVLDVLRLLRNQGVPAVLLRVGRKFTPELKAGVHRLGLEQWVHELGPLSDEELAAIYRVSHALLFPSHKEGFGWPVVEAMASGLPVVASTASSITASLAGSGFQAHAKDIDGLVTEVASVWESSSVRERLRSTGLQRAKSFSRQEVGRQLEEVYCRVCAEAEGRDASPHP